MISRITKRNLMVIRFSAALSLGIVGLMAVRPAAAQTPAVSFTSSTFQVELPDSFSLGFSFTTGATPLTVTSVGYINDGATGAFATHQVQMYRITGNGTVLNPGTSGIALLPNAVSVTTSGGTVANNTFTYVPLTTALTLTANTAYEIVATESGYGFSKNAIAPVYTGITYGTSTYAIGTTSPIYNNAVASGNDVGNFGPNFLTQNASVAVPEAGSVSLLLSGVLTLGGMVVVRRKKA